MTSLHFVEPLKHPQPPDYLQIKATSDARIAAEKAAEALEAQRQAEAARARQAATGALTGTHEDWMAAAGIAPMNYGYVDYIISHESGWDPTNWYGKSVGYPYSSESSAAGLPQALPYSKTGCAWGDAVCQLKWANSYAQKYGGWAGAYQYWIGHHNW